MALKEALDRATDIIRPSPTVSDESRCSSPLQALDDNIKITLENIEVREAMFENLFGSKIGSVDPDSEIQSIERTSNGEDLDQLSQNTYKVNKGVANGLNLSDSASQCLTESPINDAEDKENVDDNMTTLMLLGNKNHDISCNSCPHTTTLVRRRSLPSTLGQLKSYSRSSIGRLPIRRGVSHRSYTLIKKQNKRTDPSLYLYIFIGFSISI